MNFIRYGLVLSGIRSGADDEVVGEAGDLSKVENYNVRSLLGLGGAYGGKPFWICNLCGRIEAGWPFDFVSWNADNCPPARIVLQ
jgi:hypothetical protein